MAIRDARVLLVLLSSLVISYGRGQGAETTQSSHLRQRKLQQVQPVVQQYSLLTSSAIRDRVLEWKARYTNFVRVTTAQEAFDLPAAGGASDCPFEASGIDGCLNYIVTLQDFITHPEGSESAKRLPEVLWSGEVHGNERVGPTAVLEAAQLLLNASACEAMPKTRLADAKNQSLWYEQAKKAKACRVALNNRGIDGPGRRWLARLLSTRRIVIVPTANALGYYRNVREEGVFDPNRDFPYDVMDPRNCMQTIAARTLNEVFRQHMFQLSFTFHGGMEIIGYEWGATSKLGGLSPDDIAQNQISAAYSRYGGGWKQSPPYDYGDMNSKVYPVEGGMEDWAYAGSWDTSRVVQCQPTTFGGYPMAKTAYDSGTLRAFNILVETSNDKTPAEKSLGTSEDILAANSSGTGHVSRNIRLSLLSAELVEPYVSIVSVNNLVLSDDVVPQSNRNGRACQNTKLVGVPDNRSTVTVRWTVGGSLTVDDTSLWYARWSDIPTSQLDCIQQPDASALATFMKVATPVGATSGQTRFSPNKQNLTPFIATFDISDYKSSDDKLVVVALAKVDQDWTDLPMGATILPKGVTQPQSHIVNARTNSSWYYATDSSIIQGRLYWFSIPLTIQVVTNTSGQTVELSKRM